MFSFGQIFRGMNPNFSSPPAPTPHRIQKMRCFGEFDTLPPNFGLKELLALSDFIFHIIAVLRSSSSK